MQHDVRDQDIAHSLCEDTGGQGKSYRARSARNTGASMAISDMALTAGQAQSSSSLTRNSRSTGSSARTRSAPSACTTSAISGTTAATAASRAARPDGADRHELLPGVLPIGADVDVSGPFQLGQRVGHRPARDMKRLGQLRRGAFVVDPRQVVQDREMRQLHPLGQHLGDAVARQLVGHEQLAEQGNRDVVGLFGRSWPVEAPVMGQARARGAAPRSTAAKVEVDQSHPRLGARIGQNLAPGRDGQRMAMGVATLAVAFRGESRSAPGPARSSRSRSRGPAAASPNAPPR